MRFCRSQGLRLVAVTICTPTRIIPNELACLHFRASHFYLRKDDTAL